MKIVQINAVYEFSSTGRTTRELHTYLRESGHQSYVFCNNKSDINNNIYKIGTYWEYKLHRFLGCLFGLQGYFSFVRTYWMIKKLRAIDPDVVVLRNLHSNSTQLPMILNYLRKMDVPTVIVLHDCWMFTGFCTYYTKDNCYKWKQGCYKCPLIKGKKNSWIFDTSSWVYNNKKKHLTQLKKLAVIGVSVWVANEARMSFLKDSMIIKSIYNWIDLNVFRPVDASALRNRLHLNPNDFVILGVAQQWSEAKGLSYYYHVAEKYTDIRIVMVGGFNKVPLPNMIAVGSLTSTSELAEYYSLADVFLNFTQQETFGKVTAEAISCGTPVIVNNNTASPELVGDCGIVIPNNDLESCYKAISVIKERGKEFYKNRCRERAIKLFDKEKQLKKYNQLFEELSSLKNLQDA